MEAAAQVFRALVFVGLVVLLAVLPMPLGGNRAWAMAALQVAVGVLVLLTGLGLARSNGDELAYGRVLPGLALGSLALGWAFLQTVSFMPEAWHHPAWMLAGEALDGPVAGAIAVNPERARFEALMMVAYGVVFLAAFWVAGDRTYARRLLGAVVVISCAYALYGLGLRLFGLAHVLYLPTYEMPRPYRFTGPFVNPSHFATYLGLGLAAAAALFAHDLRNLKVSEEGQARLGQLLAFFTGLGAVRLVGVLLLLGAIVLTASRGGALAALAGLSVVGLAFALKPSGSQTDGRSWRGAAVALGMVIMAVVVVEIAGGTLRTRLEDIAPSVAARPLLWEAALSMIRDAPWLGTGLGSFQDLYPMYAVEVEPGRLARRAHNEYLELAVGLGLPGALAYLAGLGFLAWVCLRGVIERRRDMVFSVAGLAAAGVAASHTVVEFSFEIPAVAVLFAVLLAIGCAQATSRSGQTGRQGRKVMMDTA